MDLMPVTLDSIHRDVPDGLPSHVVLPNEDGFSLSDLAQVVRQLLGVEVGTSPLRARLQLEEADCVVLLVLDGLGWRALEGLWSRGEAAGLRQLATQGRLQPLTSVFPPTTVTALSSLATGRSPLEHGLVGYRLYLREIRAITDMIRLSLEGTNRPGSAVNAGLNLESLLPVETIYATLESHGVETHAVLPRSISGSGLSTILYRGCPHIHAVASFDDLCVQTRHLLEQRTGRSLLSLYWPGIDSIAHVRGPQTENWFAEVRSVDASLTRELAESLKNAVLLITADHGFTCMTPDDYTPFSELNGYPERSILPPTGEPRASYVYLRDGTTSKRSSDSLCPRADGLVSMSIERALEIRLFGSGQPHPELRSRLGDELLVSTGRGGILQPYAGAVRLPGMHGGLTEDEMVVPLIAASL